ncbi:uncharacterized protein LOC134741794 [Cydia strobilella]|uniref:uncharacterized protein LOC134741794 n=1 Tax=Cydia strobilella TaxID=1100964 RepID=UPI003006A93B
MYVNNLIEELSRAGIGFSVSGKIMNNISYADDMALLSPSIGALETLIGICERYAEAHGLRYKSKKSELLLFKAGTKKPMYIPPLKLGGVELKTVTQFKYLGHWVTEDLTDDLDVERERRALAVRSHMLARSASGMFAEARVDGFQAIMRKRVASLMRRVRDSPSSLLNTVMDRIFDILNAKEPSLLKFYDEWQIVISK